jgi:hypothetical protein
MNWKNKPLLYYFMRRSRRGSSSSSPASIPEHSGTTPPYDRANRPTQGGLRPMSRHAPPRSRSRSRSASMVEPISEHSGMTPPYDRANRPTQGGLRPVPRVPPAPRYATRSRTRAESPSESSSSSSDSEAEFDESGESKRTVLALDITKSILSRRHQLFSPTDISPLRIRRYLDTDRPDSRPETWFPVIIEAEKSMLDTHVFKTIRRSFEPVERVLSNPWGIISDLVSPFFLHAGRSFSSVDDLSSIFYMFDSDAHFLLNPSQHPDIKAGCLLIRKWMRDLPGNQRQALMQFAQFDEMAHSISFACIIVSARILICLADGYCNAAAQHHFFYSQIYELWTRSFVDQGGFKASVLDGEIVVNME